MTEEQNKLVAEIDTLHKQLTEVRATVDEIETLLEREPATEAVRGTMSEVTAPVIAAPGAFNLSEFVNAADIGGADSPHQVVYKLQRAINATLQGKGASQGQAYTFERYRNGVLMAEGIRVHASNLAEARKKAEKLKDEGDDIRARAPDEQKG